MLNDDTISLEELLAIDDSEEIDKEYKEEISEEQTQIKLKEVGELCTQAEEQQNKVKELTKQLKEEEARLKELLEYKIPETLESVGLKELKLSSGKKITIVEELAFNISEQRKASCMQWLRDNNFDSIIKNVVSAQFAKGEDDKALKIYRELLANGYNATHKEDVHYQTMKAFLKEQCAKNALSTSEKELFGIYEYKMAKIK